jgi:suppressor for copper-sensitivity B
MMRNLSSILQLFSARPIAAIALTMALFPGVAVAEPSKPIVSEWQGTKDAAVRLIAGPGQTDADGRVWLGLQFRLAPGWKTYWRNPGESGARPLFDWRAADNIKATDIRWPAPKRFSAYGFDSFGYSGEVVLPILLAAATPSQAITARLNLSYMICANVCVPMQADLALDINPGPKSGSSTPSPLIRRYLDRVPSPMGKTGMTINSTQISGLPGKQILHIKGHSDRPFEAPDLMVEGPEPFGFGRPTVTYSAERRDVAMALPVYVGPGKAKLTDQTVTLTLVDGPRAIEHRLKLKP